MASNRIRPVAEITTRHYAFVQWWWADSHVHDADYLEKVYTAMQACFIGFANELNVVQDPDFSCQFEGFQIYGDTLENVQTAGNRLAATLSRFKHIIPLDS